MITLLTLTHTGRGTAWLSYYMAPHPEKAGLPIVPESSEAMESYSTSRRRRVAHSMLHTTFYLSLLLDMDQPKVTAVTVWSQPDTVTSPPEILGLHTFGNAVHSQL